MNGYAHHSDLKFDEDDNFGPANGAVSALRTFDAFPKTKSSYTQSTASGSSFTLGIIILSLLLVFTEMKTWWSGTESHHFSVERGIGHELQLNLDIVVHMPCQDLHINVQDAAMDRIMAGDLLTREDTSWSAWTRKRPSKGHFTPSNSLAKNKPNSNAPQSLDQREEDELDRAAELRRRRAAEKEDSHVHHVLNHMRESRSSKKFTKSPRLRRGEVADSCRIYGSLEGNKVQGDFHITARGHGYMDPWIGSRKHLDHKTFNFSHMINELSFGPHYPNLLNPLDATADIATEKQQFHKFQYYLSIVPTIYTKRRVSTSSGALNPAAIPQPATLDLQPQDLGGLKLGEIPAHVTNPEMKRSKRGGDSIFTNQYAATGQSHAVNEHAIPGIFFKYDIEPILLIVSASRGGFWALVVRLVNVVAGIVVGGGWVFQIWEWAREGYRKRRGRSEGFLHGRMGGEKDGTL